MRALDVLTFGYTENLRAKQWPAFEVGLLSPPRQQYSSWKTALTTKTLLKAQLFGLSIWKKWCLDRGIAKAEMKITSRSILTLCSGDSTPKLKQTWLNLANDDSIPSKVIRTQTEQCLDTFAGLRTFLCLIDVKISLNITVWIVRGHFDRMHRFE